MSKVAIQGNASGTGTVTLAAPNTNTDYIDGVVKGDQAQIDAYIAACQAVKAKYPKE